MLTKYLFTFFGAWGTILLFYDHSMGGGLGPALLMFFYGTVGGLLGLAVHRVRHRIWEAVEIALTLAWWTLRSRGRALVSILRGKPELAAVQGEGL